MKLQLTFKKSTLFRICLLLNVCYVPIYEIYETSIYLRKFYLVNYKVFLEKAYCKTVNRMELQDYLVSQTITEILKKEEIFDILYIFGAD